jgi:hypothetical protein
VSPHIRKEMDGRCGVEERVIARNIEGGRGEVVSREKEKQRA